MTNSSLITVFNGQIATQPVQLCNARELHAFLEVKNHFKDWIKDRISDYGFIQDEDYIIVTERTNGRPRKEYHITLDMGKELGMVERNEKGRQIRKFFIECERKLKEIQKNQQLALPEPEPKYPFELTEYEIQLLLWLWFSNYNTHELLDMLIEPLEYIGSRYAPTIRSHKAEYARFIDESVEIIYRLTKDFHKSRDENWVNPLFSVKSVIFHQKEMRKKHEAKMKKAEEKRFPHTNF